MAIDHVPEWMAELEDEDVNFIKKFVLSSGSLKDMAKQYGVTYPTVRLRLDKLIEKIEQEDETEDDSYVKLIKRMAINNQIDYNAAKILIKEFKRRL